MRLLKQISPLLRQCNTEGTRHFDSVSFLLSLGGRRGRKFLCTGGYLLCLGRGEGKLRNSKRTRDSGQRVITKGHKAGILVVSRINFFLLWAGLVNRVVVVDRANISSRKSRSSRSCNLVEQRYIYFVCTCVLIRRRRKVGGWRRKISDKVWVQNIEKKGIVGLGVELGGRICPAHLGEWISV